MFDVPQCKYKKSLHIPTVVLFRAVWFNFIQQSKARIYQRPLLEFDCILIIYIFRSRRLKISLSTIKICKILQLFVYDFNKQQFNVTFSQLTMYTFNIFNVCGNDAKKMWTDLILNTISLHNSVQSCMWLVEL